MESQPVVLVVEDERELADLYVDGLSNDYTVRTAYDGEEALDQIDDEVDVILLDRRMPGLSGDELLETIRDRGYDCRVVMVTAVDADLDILEMEFDDYLTKPVTVEEIQETISRMVSAASDDDDVQREYYRLLSKRYTLESRMGIRELQETPEYTALLDDVTELRDRLEPETARRTEADASAAAFSSSDSSQELTIDFDRGTIEAEPPSTPDEPDETPSDEPTETSSEDLAETTGDERTGDSYDALRDQSPLYSTLFDSLRDAVIVVDDDWSVIDTNRTFERRFGFERAEFVGERFSEMLADPDELEALVADEGAALGDPDSFITLEYRAQDGQSRWCETHGFQFDEGGESAPVYGFVLRETDDGKPTDDAFEYGPD